MKKFISNLFIACLPCLVMAQSKSNVVLKQVAGKQKISIHIRGKLFTEFIYTDTLEKPFLYPIYAPDGTAITRGFPWNPEPNDPVDHPHHIGLWLNYENVNGLDFWNNSYAIPVERKNKYGWIRTKKIGQTKNGQTGLLTYTANWTDQQKHILLAEKTSYAFSAPMEGIWVIDRQTELTAAREVTMPDVKDGMLGLRVAHELELPVLQNKEYNDANGNITKVLATKDVTTTGNYLSASGKQGNAVWGTRGSWCMLYGKKGQDTISIAIIDHPKNPGYPTYWHARDYGLFSANPLGQKVFSNGKEVLNFTLNKGQSTTFRYRIVIAATKERLSILTLEKLQQSFIQTSNTR